MNSKPDSSSTPNAVNRRRFLSSSAVAGSAAVAMGSGFAATTDSEKELIDQNIVRPPENKRLLLSCKMGMIASKRDDKSLTLVERLTMAKEAGFDGVDFDQAAPHSPQAVRKAVRESGVFVHNAINHSHWRDRLTSANKAVRDQGRANIEHCLRVSHAAGGSAVLIVIGRGEDGSEDQTTQRCRDEIKQLLPLAASLGQMILIENVWNRMFYDHDGAPEQSADKFTNFVDSFQSPWVGMYYDIGNHWKYGQPADWIKAFGHRCVKLDVKGFSREHNKFTDIGEGDLPWDEVRKSLDEIEFTGWATAEVGGGDVARLTVVRKQMEKVFGLA